MLILIAPKFHPRHSRPRAADTDSATIPTSSPPLPLSSLLLLLSPLPFIIFTADRYCRLPLRYHRSAAPFIIFSLLPAVLRLALIPPPVPLSPTAVAAATVVHYHRCRCREYNRREYNRYRCSAKQSQRSLAPLLPLPSPLNFKF